MLDIGWSEILIIAVVAILVVGPKDLPRLLRQIGNFVGKIKRTANEFKNQFDDAIRDSELDELKSEVSDLNPLTDIRDELENSISSDDIFEMEDIDLDVEDPPDATKPEREQQVTKENKEPSADRDLQKTQSDAAEGDVSDAQKTPADQPEEPSVTVANRGA
ncbi:MAG: Sec-independent protein translocase protein TatB [Methyloligellaceae bacterium]